jgi:hypothetical protein
MKNKTRETCTKFYKVMALPILLHGSETWTIKTEDITEFKQHE